MTVLANNFPILDPASFARSDRNDSQSAATFLMDDAGRVQAFDAEAERLFHCRAEDVLGQLVFTLLPGFPRALLKQPDLAPTSQILRLEACPKDGSSLPVELTVTRMRVAGQQVWVGALCDVRRHRQTEEALRRSGESYRSLFDRALIGIFQTSPDGHYLRANQELARIYGYESPEALIVQNANAARNLYLLPGRREEFKHRLACDESVADFESQIQRPDGSVCWISENARVVRDDDGKLLHYEGTVQDITARKQTESDLRESEQQTRAIFEAAGVGIVRVDMAGRLTRSNPAFQKMLGYTSEELEGTAFARLTHPDDSPGNLQYQWDLQEGLRDGYQIEKRYCRQDGSPVWADLTMSLVRDGEGQSQFAIAVVEDITERRETQQTILALNGHLERRVQRIAALHQIDMAIMSSPDMEATLGLLLDQVRALLGVDAATVLLCCPQTQTLEYAASSGLRSPLSDRTPQTMGFGIAGQAAREQRIVQAPNLVWRPEVFSHDPAMAAEGFVVYWTVPLIAKGQVRGVLEVFHRSALEPDDDWCDFLDILAAQAAIAIDSATMFRDLQRSNQELREAYEATIEGWGRALDLRDQETEGHSRRVTDLAERLARLLGVSEAEIVHVRRGALLHDIGKMGVPDRILLKSDDLTATEWRTMRRHPQDAYDMLSPIAFLRPALDIPYCHHEKWNGEGYPRGLKGEQIPLAARLFAVADVWDALRSDRPYRASWSEAQTLDHIRSLSGAHFDPVVVQAFLEMLTGKPDLSRDEPPESDLLPLPRAA